MNWRAIVIGAARRLTQRRLLARQKEIQEALKRTADEHTLLGLLEEAKTIQYRLAELEREIGESRDDAPVVPTEA